MFVVFDYGVKLSKGIEIKKYFLIIFYNCAKIAVLTAFDTFPYFFFNDCFCLSVMYVATNTLFSDGLIFGLPCCFFIND